MDFKELTPPEQYRYVRHCQDVSPLYVHAKDDLIRLAIVKKSQSTILAKRLSHNTKYSKVKAAISTVLKIADMDQQIKEGSPRELTFKDITTRLKDKTTFINYPRIAKIQKEMLMEKLDLSDEEMKKWIEEVKNLNTQNSSLTNLADYTLGHMTDPEKLQGFNIKYYFNTFLDGLVHRMNKGANILLPKKGEEA